VVLSVKGIACRRRWSVLEKAERNGEVSITRETATNTNTKSVSFILGFWIEDFNEEFILCVSQDACENL
jgi:hypothetical protein